MFDINELFQYLQRLAIPDLILCAAAVVILDVFALSIILSANREAKLCRKRWQKVSNGLELRFWDNHYPLEADEILLGRHISADIRLSDASVSRYHAVMTVSAGVWSITDLDSKSGTFVNDRKVKQAKLHPGDCIRLGNVQMYLARQTVGEPVRRRKGGNPHV
ncbi:MAG: FHA domain-containing protein [Oscillospiraceae bacterium]|nr:FHA domain-containing protein [Oscillospiraceae bacterium]